MEILAKYSCVSINVWLHHLDSTEMNGKKATWKLFKDATKQQLVYPLTNHTDHPMKMSKTILGTTGEVRVNS